jgi:cytidyltransferase-like protein
VKIAVVSGGFDPLHSGHINYLEHAADFGDKLVVLVNSDEWLTRKKGRPFMPFEERSLIIQRMDMVDNVYAVDDNDGSVTTGLTLVRNAFGHQHEYVFCNGGDRGKDNIPEMAVEGYTFEFGVGGESKANSSSWILKEWKYPTERRVWGEFSDLFQDEAVRVKELIIEPGKGISYQRHFKRDEIWFVSKGECEIKHGIYPKYPDNFALRTLRTDESFTVKRNEWHQIINKTTENCHIIEIQYGGDTHEDDIERISYYDGE